MHLKLLKDLWTFDTAAAKTPGMAYFSQRIDANRHNPRCLFEAIPSFYCAHSALRWGTICRYYWIIELLCQLKTSSSSASVILASLLEGVSDTASPIPSFEINNSWSLQSDFKNKPSTETVLCMVANDVLRNDAGNISELILLDHSGTPSRADLIELLRTLYSG